MVKFLPVPQDAARSGVAIAACPPQDAGCVFFCLEGACSFSRQNVLGGDRPNTPSVQRFPRACKNTKILELLKWKQPFAFYSCDPRAITTFYDVSLVLNLFLIRVNLVPPSTVCHCFVCLQILDISSVFGHFPPVLERCPKLLLRKRSVKDVNLSMLSEKTILHRQLDCEHSRIRNGLFQPSSRRFPTGGGLETGCFRPSSRR